MLTEPLSEAESYRNLAASLGILDGIRERVNVENYARDSHENVVFSLCRFYEITRQYPREITIVGHDFKRDRFLDVHRKAIRFPEDRFHYIGIDPPKVHEARLGEAETVQYLLANPYINGGGPLLAKRLQRDPYHQSHEYKKTVPDLARLIDYASPNFDYPSQLPWEI